LPWAIAATLAAGIGVIAIVKSSTSPPAPQAAPAPPADTGVAPSAPTPAPTPAPTAAPRAEVEALTIQVDSNPPGAAVLEGAKELCPSTPCEITWRGEAAAPSAQHELSFEKKGYKPATITVSSAEDKVKAKLEIAPAGKMPGAKVPTGYKDAY
jgi:serine/threonine-protein kinase